MFLKIVRWVPLVVSIVFMGTLQLSSGAYLRCYGYSKDEYDVAPLQQAENILNSRYYNSTHKNLIYTFGFTGNVDGIYTRKVLDAALLEKDRNVFVLDWGKEASGIKTLGKFGYIFSYIFSGLPQTSKVGFDLGRALDTMSDKGFKLNGTHAMGHSLGAHVFGNAGRYLVNVGKSLSRISGCDPAGAFFDRYISVMPALDKTCADFVDNTFTDPGGYAMNSSIAHLNVWVNFGNFIYGTEEEQVQPGCPIGNYEMFSENDLCSHNRVLDLWLASWSGATLKADKADDYSTWNNDTEHGVTTDVMILGDYTNIKAFGNYYMNTTGSPPYQQNTE